MLISDRTTRVILMLGNRSDLATRAVDWIKDAYIELGMGYPFEELEVSRDDQFVANNDTYDLPLDDNGVQVRACKHIKCMLSASSPIVMTRKDMKIVDRIPPTPGAPVIFAPFAKQVVVRMVPNQSYNIVWRCWAKPYIATPTSGTILNLPDDWMEILDYAAALRGHIELLERDKAAELRQLLYGSTDPRTGRQIPGLIKMKMTQRQAEAPSEEYGTTPRVRNYTHVV